MSTPKVSVIIPAYNETTFIDRLLEPLTRQKFEDFEVIVSDAHSKDGTKEVVEWFGKRLSIKFVEAPPKGPGYGRNQGAKLARGQWLLFLDADVDIDDPNFIKTLVEETTSHGWNTSSARMKTKTGPSYDRLLLYQRALAHTRRPVASGYCILTKRSVFKSAGGFNEKIRFGEDYEYVSRVGKHGFGFVLSTTYYVDPRRNHEEKLAMRWKGTLNEIKRLLFGNKHLEKNSIKYEFGKHKARERD